MYGIIIPLFISFSNFARTGGNLITGGTKTFNALKPIFFWGKSKRSCSYEIYTPDVIGPSQYMTPFRSYTKTNYTYDGSGNRLSKTDSSYMYPYIHPGDKNWSKWPHISSVTTYEYNDADKLISDSTGNSYSYSGRGELINIINQDYELNLTWNNKGELTGATDTEGVDLS